MAEFNINHPKLNFIPFWSFQELSCSETRLVQTLRLSIMAWKAGLDPIAHAASKLGSANSAYQFRALIDNMALCWGDEFQINRPCCTRLTCDEQLLIQLFRSAARDQRNIFDYYAHELMSQSKRDKLYQCLQHFTDVYLNSEAQPMADKYGLQ